MKKLILLVLFFNAFTLLAQKQTSDTSVVKKEKKLQLAVYPAVGYTPETNLQLGAVAFMVYKNPKRSDGEFYRPTSISPYVIYTLNNQLLTAIDFDIYFNNGLKLNTNLRYYNFTDFFYGIGNDNSIDDEETYTDRYVRLEGRILKPLNGKFFYGIRYYFQNNKISELDPDGVLANDDILGTGGGWTNGIGPAVLFDTRNSTLYPTQGTFIRAEMTFHGNALGSDYTFGHYLLDIRKFYKIKSDKNVIAWQAYGEFTSEKDIPFYRLPRIGGDTRLRGIANANLYRDRQAWCYLGARDAGHRR